MNSVLLPVLLEHGPSRILCSTELLAEMEGCNRETRYRISLLHPSWRLIRAGGRGETILHRVASVDVTS